MNVLFLHPNFPAQYVHLAGFFAQSRKNKVVFITKEDNGNRINGVQVIKYESARACTEGIHQYVKPMEEAVLDGQAVCRVIHNLKQQGFVPDVIVAHTGWGSSLYVKDLYPKIPLIGYFEWFYTSSGADVGYWEDEVVDINDKLRIRSMNAHHLVNLDACDARYCPTQWQKSQFPKEYRDSMKVFHEGIDTKFCCPQKGTKLVLPRLNLDLSDKTEIVTYVSRGFEEYRGFPQFMEAVRILLRTRPKCHVVIVGNDKSFYGPPPAPNKTYKEIELEKGGFDLSRVHFTGHLNRVEYLNVLQSSTVHVYLTRPFVLSWSMLEAMSAGVCLVASATPPVQEVVEDGHNGLLANFRLPEHIAFRINEALMDVDLREKLSKNARETILERYDLPKMLVEQVNFIYSQIK